MQSKLDTNSSLVRLSGRGTITCDAEIIQGLINGNPAAANAFYDEYSDFIDRLVRRFLGPDVDHEDVVQGVFVQVLASVKNVKNADSFRSWLVAVTANTVRFEIRNKRKRSFISLFGQKQVESISQMTAESRTVVNRFYSIIDKLHCDDRIALILRIGEDYSLKEIAEICNCSLGTVKRRINRARKCVLKHAKQDAILASYVEDCDVG